MTTGEKAACVLLGIGAFSLLPIWRTATRPGHGLNFWEFIKYNNVTDDGVPHISYELAKIMAGTFNRMNQR